MKNQIIIAAFISSIVGAGAGYLFSQHQSASLVKLEKTKSGTFIITDGRIFSVSELSTAERMYGTLK